MSDNEPETDRWVDAKGVMALTGFSRPSITRMVKEGRIPQPFQPRGSSKLVWWESEIRAWMQNQDTRHEAQQG